MLRLKYLLFVSFVIRIACTECQMKQKFYTHSNHSTQKMDAKFDVVAVPNHVFENPCIFSRLHAFFSPHSTLFFSFRRCINVGHPWIKLFVVFFFFILYQHQRISLHFSCSSLLPYSSDMCNEKKNWVSSPLNWIKFTLIRISVMDSHVHVHSFNLDFNIYCACTHLLSHTYNYYHPLSSLFFIFNLWFILSHRAIIICRLPPFNAFILDVVCFFFISFFNRSPYAFLFSRSFLSDTMSVY